MFQNKTEQNRDDEKDSQTGITFEIHTNDDGVRATAIMLRSMRLAISSYRSEASLRIYIGRPSIEQLKRLRWYPFQCVEWKATSVTATQFYGAFIPRNLHSFFLKFDCRSVIIQTHLAVCFLIVIWKTYVFYEPQFCGISLNILLSGKSVKLEKGRNTRRRRVFLPTSFVL